jgi:hypothetical protein
MLGEHLQGRANKNHSKQCLTVFKSFDRMVKQEPAQKEAGRGERIDSL